MMGSATGASFGVSLACSTGSTTALAEVEDVMIEIRGTFVRAKSCGERW